MGKNSDQRSPSWLKICKDLAISLAPSKSYRGRVANGAGRGMVLECASNKWTNGHLSMVTIFYLSDLSNYIYLYRSILSIYPSTISVYRSFFLSVYLSAATFYRNVNHEIWGRKNVSKPYANSRC
jgi:hypothetical protein